MLQPMHTCYKVKFLCNIDGYNLIQGSFQFKSLILLVKSPANDKMFIRIIASFYNSSKMNGFPGLKLLFSSKNKYKFMDIAGSHFHENAPPCL